MSHRFPGPEAANVDLLAIQDLEQHAEQLAAIVASSHDAIISKTLDGVIRTWNASAERLFGYRADEAIGRPITLIVPPEWCDEERMILNRIRSGHRVDPFETERVAKDGRSVRVLLSVSPVRNAHGAVVGAAKIALEVTERHETELRMRETQRQLAQEAHALLTLSEWSSRLWQCPSLEEGLRQMLDAVIALLGADMGNVQLLEGPLLRMAASRGFDQSFLDFFASVSADDDCGCGRALRTRERVVIEDIDADEAYAPYRSMAHASGYCSVVCTPLVTADGTILGVLNTQFVVHHRPNERNLRRLDLYARQATDFIQRCRIEEALRRSEAALRESDRRKSEFLATLAHELRNPLGPITSGLHILDMARNDQTVFDRASAMMKRQLEHVVRLVDDLMDVARIGGGKVALRLQTVDLRTLIDRAIETSRPRIEAGHHHLTIDTPDNPIWISADDIRLVQVFTNLLINAAKYTPDGGRITVRTIQSDEQVVIDVIDTGAGIPAEILDVVFDLFAQADASAERAEGGIGVGLSLVKGLVELHGGTVIASSDGVGKGSCFTVNLPVVRGAMPAENG